MPASPPALVISVSSLMVPMAIATSASVWTEDAPAEGATFSVPGRGADCEGVGLVSMFWSTEGVVMPNGPGSISSSCGACS
eukprot:15411444-Heterocapsa_arctica.AAC.1